MVRRGKVSEKERMLVTRPTALTVLCAAVYGCAAFGPCDVSQINQRESDGIGTCGLAASAPKAPTAIANDPASHRLEKAQKSRNLSLLFFLSKRRPLQRCVSMLQTDMLCPLARYQISRSPSICI